MAKTIITIGRQFGSNGRNIGRKLAERFPRTSMIRN